MASKQKLKGLSKLQQLKASLPPATVKRNTEKGAGRQLMLMVPAETLQALKVRAAEQGTTSRALVLDSLKKAGFPVPASELTDRRARKE